MPILYNEFAVVVGSLHDFFALMVLPLASAIERIDRSLDEAATTLGAFVIPSLLGGRTVSMLGNTMEAQILSVFDWPFGATVAVQMVALIVLSTVLATALLPRGGRGSA